MNINYQLTLSDNPYWIKTLRPVKLIHLKLNSIDNRFKVQRIHVFLGDPEIKKIINNPKALQKKFGSKWREILHKNAVKGGQLIDIGDSKDTVKKKTPKKPKTMDSIVQYVYDYGIYLDDSIENIKTKIELETGVSPVNQHLFWNTEKGVYKPFDYYIKYLTRLDVNYPINILDLFKDSESNKLLGLPIDTQLIKEYRNRNIKIISYLYHTYYSVIYKNFNNYNEKNYELNTVLPFTLYLVDLDSIHNYIDRTKYEQINTMQYSRFYSGLLLKYWPGINSKSKNIFVTKSSKDLTIAKNNYMLQTKIKNWISEVDCKSVKKYFKPNLTIEMMQMKVNYDMDLYLNKELVDIRILYEYLEPGDFIKEIKYSGRIKRAGCPSENIPLGTGRTELKTIDFRLDVGKDRTPMMFKLNRSGHYNIDNYGKQVYKTSIHSFIEEIFVTANKLIDKINSLGNIVLVGGFKLEPLSYYNICLKFMNAPVHLQLVNNTVEEQDLVYIDPIKFPALLSIMQSYFKPNYYKFNEPTDGIIHSMTVHFIRIPEFNKLASKKIINQMNPNTNIEKENKIRVIFLHDNLFKISMSGVRDISVYHHTYNFLARIVYLYHEFNAGRIKDPIINKLLSQAENKFMVTHKQYIKYSIPYSKIKSKDIVTADNVYEYLNKNKSFKEIKLLKDTDSVLFNYDHLYKTKSGRKLKPYSKVCQAGMQPIPMTASALKKWDNYKEGVTPTLKYSNKTKSGQDIHYVCPYRVYKYPGFQRYDRHPKGYCLPCCRKKNFLNNPGSMAYRRYTECMKTGQVPVKLERKRIANKMYIKGYGKANANRYSWLPVKLMAIFNEPWKHSNSQDEFINKCPYKKIRQLDTQISNCVLLRGIKQSNISYITAIESALDLQYNSLLPILIDSLKKHKSVFSSLEMGMIKTRFESMNNYIEFLNNTNNFINENTVENLVNIFNPVFPKKLNIIIFSLEDKDIKLKSKHDNIYLSQLLANPEYYHIILIKDKMNYYPLFRKGDMVFTNDNIITKIIKNIVDSTSTINMKNNTESSSLLKFNALIVALHGLMDRYKVDSQYIMVNKNKVNIVIGLCLQEIKSKKKFIVPVDPSPSTNLPLLSDYVCGDYQIVRNFLDSSGIYINYKLLLNTKMQVIGFLLETSGRVILVSPVKYKKEMGTRLAYRYNPNDIKKGTRSLNYDLTEQSYLNQLHHVVEIELNNKLFTERNKDIRGKIKSILISNLDKTQSQIMSKIYSQLSKLGTEDYHRIKQIINLAQYQNKYDKKSDIKIIIKNLLSASTFNFDLDTVRKLKRLINEFRMDRDHDIEKKIVNILDINLKKIIKIMRPNFDNTSNIRQDSTLIDLCLSKTKGKCSRTKIVGRQQCYFNTDNNSCLIIMDKDNYAYHLLRLKDELIENEAKQVDLLDIRLDTLVENL